jgi:MYXO-CTERM domain-containing protein
MALIFALAVLFAELARRQPGWLTAQTRLRGLYATFLLWFDTEVACGTICNFAELGGIVPPMKTNRHLLNLVIGLTVLVGLLIASPRIASAAGSITYTRKTIEEVNGGWKISMTVVYGGKPAMPHVPMRFIFTPTMILERYLDDAHGDKPQTRRIPLVGQVPLVESQDVDFSDPRGKIGDRTKFDFVVSRPHNFSAGEYSVIVKRARCGGVAIADCRLGLIPVGTTQTLVFNGDNPIIDRRSITFVSSDTGKKKGAGDSANGAKAQAASAEKAPETAPKGEVAGTGEKGAAEQPTDKPEGASDPADLEKVPPTSRGCGCRTAGGTGPFGAGMFAAALMGLGLARLRRRPER